MSKRNDNSTISNDAKVEELSNQPKTLEVDAKKSPKNTAEKFVVDPNYDPVDSFGKHRLSTSLKNLKPSKNDVSRKQKLFKYIITIVFTIFIVGVLVYTAYTDFFTSGPIEWAKVGNALKSNWYYFVFALLSLGVCFFSKGFKLSFNCKLLSGKWHFKTCIETAIIGHYYNAVTPLAVGGQPFEIYHLSKNGVHGGIASSLPIATFFFNQFAFVVLGIISLLFLQFGTLGLPVDLVIPTYVTLFTIIGLATCLLMPSLVIIFSMFPRVGSGLVKFVMFFGKKLRIVKNPEETTFKTIKTVVHNSKCIKTLAKNPFELIANIFISLIEQIAMSSIAYFTLKAFGFPQANSPVTLLEWAQVLQVSFVLYAAVSFIPTPGNSGAADFTFFELFRVGLVTGLAFPAMMIWRFLSFYSFIIVGFIFLTFKKRKRQQVLET